MSLRTIHFNHDTVCRRLRELAYLNKGLAITFTDERIPEKPAVSAEVDADAAEENAENAASAPSALRPSCLRAAFWTM